MEAVSTRIRMRVSPGAKRSFVVGRHGEGWKVRVAAPPERGRANEALTLLLAQTLSVQPSAVTLVSGGTGREKIVELAGVEPRDVDRLLAAAAEEEQGA
jgi:uncharacterized protein (TIGR00251 family)